MRKALVFAVIFLAAGLAGHVATLHALPTLIMAKAIRTLQENGSPTNAFLMAPRMTPQTQTVVRPSPDLAYSICLFDVSDGPVLVQAARWPLYASMSVYDARTDNVAALSVQTGSGEANSIVITYKNHDAPPDEGAFRVAMDHPKGVVLIRRLAPTAELYAAAAAAAKGDVCAPL